MILDEVDKIPAQVATSRGNNLPGAFEVLKSMIEPATARGGVCPFCQIPFDPTGMSWVMTTNSIERMPAAFLDRCKLIRLETPSTVALTAGNGLLCTMLPEDACNLGGGVLKKALSHLPAARSLLAHEVGYDPIEDRLRENIRATIEAVFDEELDAFLGRCRYDRGTDKHTGLSKRSSVARRANGIFAVRGERRLIGTFGTESKSVPRAPAVDEDGKTTQWRSKALPRYPLPGSASAGCMRGSG